MNNLEQPAIASELLLLDGGPTDTFTPRDLFRAMVVARVMGEDRMADRLQQQLQDAFALAGVDCSTLFAKH